MAEKGRGPGFPNTGNEPVPPGATNQASDRDERPGRLDHTPLDDRHGAGSPGGGLAPGGLAGTNYGEGSPDDAGDLTNPMGSGVEDRGPFEKDEEEEGGPPYAGHAGGAVGGSPAEGRSKGGRTGHGLAPGGTHRGDSTIGADPERP